MKSPARLRILYKANHGAALVELALVTPVLLCSYLGPSTLAARIMRTSSW